MHFLRKFADGGSTFDGLEPYAVADGGVTTGDVLAHMPARMPEREMRRIMAKRLYDEALSSGEGQALDRHDAWKEQVGEPGARGGITTLAAELSGLPSIWRGSHHIADGYSEGDWKKGLAGAGEVALGAIPGLSAFRAGRAAMAPAMATAGRQGSTLAALGFSGAPLAIDEARAQTEDKVAKAIESDATVARLREEARDIERRRMEEADKNVKGLGFAGGESARNRKDKAFAEKLDGTVDAKGNPIPGIRQQLAEAEARVRDEYMKNAPFRDRNPGMTETIMKGAGGLAAFIPLANTLKTNLADKFVRQPAIARQTAKVEEALYGGTREPSAFGRVFGKEGTRIEPDAATFSREQDVLGRMLDARTAAKPSYLGNAALGAGLIAEGRMLPEEVDAIVYPHGHPTREAATAALTSPGYYGSGVIPSVLGGAAAAIPAKFANYMTKGTEAGIPRANAVREWSFESKGPSPRAPREYAQEPPGLLEYLGAAPQRVMQGYHDQRGRTAAAREDAAGARRAAAEEGRLASAAERDALLAQRDVELARREAVEARRRSSAQEGDLLKPATAPTKDQSRPLEPYQNPSSSDLSSKGDKNITNPVPVGQQNLFSTTDRELIEAQVDKLGQILKLNQAPPPIINRLPPGKTGATPDDAKRYWDIDPSLNGGSQADVARKILKDYAEKRGSLTGLTQAEIADAVKKSGASHPLNDKQIAKRARELALADPANASSGWSAGWRASMTPARLDALLTQVGRGGKTLAVPAGVGIGAATAGSGDAQADPMKHPDKPKHAASFDHDVERYREKDGKFAGGAPENYKQGGFVKPKLPKENPTLGRSLQVAREYASGGRVHAGPVIGATGGREDALPIDVGPNSYVVPADVVGALGEGNSIAGMRKLEKQFGKSIPHKASGGAIPIMISDGEFVLSPEQVANVGRGDMAQGHRALDAFVKRIRADHINTLSKLPPPSK